MPLNSDDKETETKKVNLYDYQFSGKEFFHKVSTPDEVAKNYLQTPEIAKGYPDIYQYITTQDILLFVDDYITSHPNDEKYDMSHIVLIDDDVEFSNLKKFLNERPIAEGKNCKVLLKIQPEQPVANSGLKTLGIHVNVMYLQNIQGILNVFMYDAGSGIYFDARARDGFDLLKQALLSTAKNHYDDFKFIVSSVPAQTDWRNCFVYAINALHYFIKSGRGLFNEIEPHLVEQNAKQRDSDNTHVFHLKIDKTPAPLLKLSAIENAEMIHPSLKINSNYYSNPNFIEENSQAIVSRKKGLTLQEYRKSRANQSGTGEEKTNIQNVEDKMVRYRKRIHTRLQALNILNKSNEFNSDAYTTFIRRCLENGLITPGNIPNLALSPLSVAKMDDLANLESESKRIMNSKPFKRLNGLYQFSINYTDSTLTNRNKHSIYVAETGQDISRRLGLSEASAQLAYNIGLIHDIGHPPFSHWGETSIKEHLGQDAFQWNHDTAGLNAVTSWAPEIMLSDYTLEGLAKRYWRYDENAEINATNHSKSELPQDTLARGNQLHLAEFNHLEGQIAAQADRIGFNATDIQDGLLIGRLTPAMLQAHFPSAYQVYQKLLNDYVKECINDFIHTSDENIENIIVNTPAIHAIVFSRFSIAFREYQINDLVTQTQKLIATHKITSAQDIRLQQGLIADFSDDLKKDFYHFAKFCREIIFAKSTKPFKIFVDTAFEHFLTNTLKLSGLYGERFDRAVSNTEKILIISEYMTREMSDQDILLQVLQYSPNIYRKHFPGYEIIKQEPASKEQAKEYLLTALEKNRYNAQEEKPAPKNFAMQTNHIITLPVEANIVIVGDGKNEVDTAMALAKRYKITDKKLSIHFIIPFESENNHLQRNDYQNLLRNIERLSQPIEVNVLRGEWPVVLSNMTTINYDHVIFKEPHPAQRAVVILADIHKNINKPSKKYNRPTAAEEAAYAKEYIATNQTSDPRFCNTNQVLPTWVQFGTGATLEGDRTYSDVRVALHNTIISKALLWNPVAKNYAEKKPDSEELPILHVISGGMSVGMTYMQRLMIYEKVIKPEHSVIITPLSFMDMPEFSARFHYQHPEKSPLLVEEYYDIVGKIAQAAMAQGLNVVIVDQADDRDAILTILDDAKKHSYRSSIVGLTMSPEAYYAASELWLTKFNRIPDHVRGFGDLREFSENWPFYTKQFDLATMIETYFHVKDIDKSEDDITRKEYEVEVLFSAYHNKKGYRVENIYSPERYSMFLDRAQYIPASANSLESANKVFPYPQSTRQLDTAKRGNANIKLISEVASNSVVPMKTVRGFFKNELELKFKEMVRKTTEQRAQVRKAQSDNNKLQLLQEVIGGAKHSIDLKNRLVSFDETKNKIVASYIKDKALSQETGTLIIIGGGPCSGKSTYLERTQETYKEEKGVVCISTSVLKQQIPEYGFLANIYKNDNPDRHTALNNNVTEKDLFNIGSNLYNLFEKEKMALTVSCINELMKLGMTVVIEDHLDNKEFAAQMFYAARANKANTVLIAPDVSVENFFLRGRARENSSGKWLMPVYALDHHKKFEENWQYYLTLADIACRVDNNSSQNNDTLSAIAIHGKLYVIQKENYLAAIAKQDLEIMRETDNDDKTFNASDVKVPSSKLKTKDLHEVAYPAEEVEKKFHPRIVQLVENATNRVKEQTSKRLSR